MGLKGKVTGHGFRSTFTDWAHEATSFQPVVIEMALNHTIKDKTEAAYRRGDLFNKRREVMLAWENFCRPTLPIASETTDETSKAHDIGTIRSKSIRSEGSSSKR